MNVRGTETEKNLLKSFAGESQARNRYNYFASVAKKEGYELISAIFEETANQEKEHAKRFFKFLEGGDLEITATYPAGKIGTTLENLKSAAGGEHEEWTELYPMFAKIAKKEGLDGIAKVYEAISIAEKRHEERYSEVLRLLEKNEYFERKESVTWRCRNCGYVHDSNSAPKACPACAHPQAHFEVSLGLTAL